MPLHLCICTRHTHTHTQREREGGREGEGGRERHLRYGGPKQQQQQRQQPSRLSVCLSPHPSSQRRTTEPSRPAQMTTSYRYCCTYLHREGDMCMCVKYAYGCVVCVDGHTHGCLWLNWRVRAWSNWCRLSACSLSVCESFRQSCRQAGRQWKKIVNPSQRYDKQVVCMYVCTYVCVRVRMAGVRVIDHACVMV